jgi:hypothetical protein
MMIEDCAAWFSRPGLLSSFMTIVALTRSWNICDNPAWIAGQWHLSQEDKASLTANPSKEGAKPPKKGSRVPRVAGEPYLSLGRLSIVEEPGKMRVVAMVDCWTQWLLYPLHRFIFDKLLRVIPQDGTFDQLKPVKKLIGEMRSKGLSASFHSIYQLQRIGFH